MSDRKNPADSKQCKAVLERLRRGPATTWQLGYELNICCVTKRISELRQGGFQIEMTEQWRGKTRICTYTLEGYGVTENAPVSVHERTDVIVACAECSQPTPRKAKARPLLQGEFAFCSDIHRAAFHRRKKSSHTEHPQEPVERGVHAIA